MIKEFFLLSFICINASDLYLYPRKIPIKDIDKNIINLLGKTLYNSKQAAVDDSISFDENNTFVRGEPVIMLNHINKTYSFVIILGATKVPENFSYKIGWVAQGLSHNGDVYAAKSIGKIPYKVLYTLLPEIADKFFIT